MPPVSLLNGNIVTQARGAILRMSGAIAIKKFGLWILKILVWQWVFFRQRLLNVLLDSIRWICSPIHMIKLSLFHLVNAKNAFQNLITLHLPMSTAFALAKSMKQINDELQFYTDKRNELVVKHGEPAAGGNGTYKISPDMKGFPNYHRQHDELLSVEVNLSIEPLKLEDLLKGSEANTLTASDVMMLEPFLEKNSEDKEVQVVEPLPSVKKSGRSSKKTSP